MDPLERTLHRGEDALPLVPKSFDVLLVLLQNRGRLMDKQELLDLVWAGVAVEENSLARAVADIRKALGEGARENRFIETVAKRGYRFVAEVASDDSADEPQHATTRLAVLPFAWLTNEGRDGSLSVGLADALITRLSNLSQIVVRPTSAILQYADGKLDPFGLGNELEADFIISGSLQQAGDRVRVTVQMVSPDQQRSVWADHFEETFTHIFSVEDSISARVAAALALKLTNAERESLTRHSTENHEAYQLYLRGRSSWSRQTFAAAREAIVYFGQAIDLDPGYALAWAGIADAHILIGLSGALTGGLPPHQIFPEAKFAALRAIELDGASAEAHTSLGFIKLFYDWNPREAHEEFQRALTRQPNHASAHHGMALAYGFSGNGEAALQAIDAALEAEPLSPILNANKGYLLYTAGRREESIAQLKRTLEIDPAFAATHYRLGLARDAIDDLQEARRLSGNSPYTLGALGYFCARAGRRTEACELLATLQEVAKSQFVSAFLMAEICVGLGYLDQALEWFDRVVAERSPALYTLNVDPRFDGLRVDPRFQRVLENLR